MPSWRDNLRPASFRNVPFFVEGHNAQGGRRGQTHEYAGRDAPYREDLGRKGRVWRIRGYVIGDDYMEQRDRLLTALEKEGPGPLVHPYLGTIAAASATEYDLSEDKQRGREASFTITFEETGENSFPATTADRRYAVSQAAKASRESAGLSFAESFSVEDRPAFVFEKSRDFAGAFLTDLLSQAQGIRAEATPVWSLVTDIRSGISRVGALVRTPGDLVGEVEQLLGAFADLLPAGRSALGPLTAFAGWGSTDSSDSPGALTPSRAQISTNRNATVSLVRRFSVAEAAEKFTAPAADGGSAFESLEEILSVRDDVVASIDAEIDVAGSSAEHDVFVGLSDLRTETIRYANEEAARLPRLRSWTPGATLPAAAIAYRLYDDATRAGEMAARNRVRHPGFVPGGEPLQVLDA